MKDVFGYLMIKIKKLSENKVLSVLLLLGLTAILSLALQNQILLNWDRSLADRQYQHRRYQSGQIALVNIDDRALEEIGPQSTWKRTVLADVIRKLNKSEEIRPAVIGVDVLFTGESDQESDQALIDAAGEYGNVVVASLMNTGWGAEENADGKKVFHKFHLIEYSRPFAGLEEVTTVGFINSVLDEDGILRHHMLEAAADGEIIPSFGKRIAEKYAREMEQRELELPDTDNGIWYIPFSGGYGDYDESVSIVSILNDEIPPEYYAGRIVLIGPYAAGMNDAFVTAADHEHAFYGVEIHANIIEALLKGEYLYEVSDRIQFVLVWAVLFLCSLVFRKKKTVLSSVCWITLCGAWICICMKAAEHGYMLHILWLPAALTLLYFGFVFYAAIVHLREKRQITNMFSHYVAPEIVKELIGLGAEGLQLGGREADIAVLFVDIRGFTSMSEQLEASEVVLILNEYLTLVTDCILQNKGTLDKFVGDCTMAVWGSPLPQEDYVMHAVQAGIDMVRRSKSLSDRLMEKYGRTVDFGVGVNVGKAVIGNMGSPMHMDYTAIGDTVNTAARLEANAPSGHIYISREVANRLGERISYISLGDTIKLKGKAEGFEVLDLLIPDETEEIIKSEE